MSFEQVFITRDCCRNCEYCFARDILKKNDNMTIEDFLFYLDFLKKYSKNNEIHFLGGEPFNHPDFREILKLADEKFPLIKISTGGTFNNSVLEGFDLSKFVFTLSYPNNEREAKIISENAKYIFDHGGKIHLSIIMNNDFDTDKAIKFVLDNKIKIVNPVMALPNIHKTNKYVEKPNKKFKTLFLHIVEELYKNNIQVGQHCFTPYCIFNKEEHLKYEKLGFPFGKCSSDSGEFIYPNLDLYICPYFDDKLGNIKTDSLSDISKRKLELMKKSTHEMIPLCKDCSYKKKGLCNPCVAYSYEK